MQDKSHAVGINKHCTSLVLVQRKRKARSFVLPNW